MCTFADEYAPIMEATRYAPVAAVARPRNPVVALKSASPRLGIPAKINFRPRRSMLKRAGSNAEPAHMRDIVRMTGITVAQRSPFTQRGAMLTRSTSQRLPSRVMNVNEYWSLTLCAAVLAWHGMMAEVASCPGRR